MPVWCVCVSMVCVCVHLYTVNFVIQTLLPLHTHVLTSLKAFTSVYSHICIFHLEGVTGGVNGDM